MIAKLPLALKVIAVMCAVPALIHGLLGVGGDFLIGVPATGAVDATLDSQNRFYGVAFGVFAVLLWLCAADIRRHASVLRILFAAMFVAGCARFLSLATHGWPTVEVMFLWATELTLPPLMWMWLRRYEASKIL